jgi:hypothetical protein
MRSRVVIDLSRFGASVTSNASRWAAVDERPRRLSSASFRRAIFRGAMCGESVSVTATVERKREARPGLRMAAYAPGPRRRDGVALRSPQPCEGLSSRLGSPLSTAFARRVRNLLGERAGTLRLRLAPGGPGGECHRQH